MILGILGLRGTGKDAIGDIIMEHGAQKIGFADHLKRICISMFDFEPFQVWGTQEEKEAPDERYPREHTWGEVLQRVSSNAPYDSKCLCCGAWAYDPDRQACFLTGRYALQIIGTEGGRHCWNNVWVKRTLDDAGCIQKGWRYNRAVGLEDSVFDSPRIALITDCRFINEVNAIQAIGGKVFRVKRPGFEKPLFDHLSETEQLQIPDDRLQGVIMNDGTLEDLKVKVQELLKE